MITVDREGKGGKEKRRRREGKRMRREGKEKGRRREVKRRKRGGKGRERKEKEKRKDGLLLVMDYY